MCEWVERSNKLEEHMATCKFSLLPCPRQCSVTQRFMRQDLEEHVERNCPNRDFKCKYCGKTGAYSYITQLHSEECKTGLVSCPNSGCVGMIQRRYMDEHVSTECDHTVIPCKYRRQGCGMELKRMDMSKHEGDMRTHFHMAMVFIEELEDRVSELENERQEGASEASLEASGTLSLRYRIATLEQKNAELEEKLATVSAFIEHCTLTNN